MGGGSRTPWHRTCTLVARCRRCVCVWRGGVRCVGGGDTRCWPAVSWSAVCCLGMVFLQTCCGPSRLCAAAAAAVCCWPALYLAWPGLLLPALPWCVVLFRHTRARCSASPCGTPRQRPPPTSSRPWHAHPRTSCHCCRWVWLLLLLLQVGGGWVGLLLLQWVGLLLLQ